MKQNRQNHDKYIVYHWTLINDNFCPTVVYTQENNYIRNYKSIWLATHHMSSTHFLTGTPLIPIGRTVTLHNNNILENIANISPTVSGQVVKIIPGELFALCVISINKIVLGTKYMGFIFQIQSRNFSYISL